MSTISMANSGAVTLTFSVTGLSDKDQTLFKSFVRLLNHRTQQRWLFQESGGDLLVASESSVPADTARPVLVLGTGAPSGRHFVSLPIHADDLEPQLNHIGGLLLKARQPQVAAVADYSMTDRVRLIRWPSTSLLTSRDRIRLATLMTGRPMSLHDVQVRSGLDRAECLAFMSELDAAGMLIHDRYEDTRPQELESAAAGSAAKVATGLLARIRNRLGLGSLRHA